MKLKVGMLFEVFFLIFSFSSNAEDMLTQSSNNMIAGIHVLSGFMPKCNEAVAVMSYADESSCKEEFVRQMEVLHESSGANTRETLSNRTQACTKIINLAKDPTCNRSGPQLVTASIKRKVNVVTDLCMVTTETTAQTIKLPPLSREVTCLRTAMLSCSKEGEKIQYEYVALENLSQLSSSSKKYRMKNEITCTTNSCCYGKDATEANITRNTQGCRVVKNHYECTSSGLKCVQQPDQQACRVAGCEDPISGEYLYFQSGKSFAMRKYSMEIKGSNICSLVNVRRASDLSDQSAPSGQRR